MRIVVSATTLGKNQVLLLAHLYISDRLAQTIIPGSTFLLEMFFSSLFNLTQQVLFYLFELLQQLTIKQNYFRLFHLNTESIKNISVLVDDHNGA